MSAYIAMLKAESVQNQRRSETQTRENDSGNRLKNEIAQWHALMPTELRQRPYRMEEFLGIFPVSPMAIGIALAQLGWVRKRNTQGTGPYIRYWVAPRI